jgi:hypothetical protein
MSTTSPATSSPATNPPPVESANINTFRLLKLRSDQADTSYSATHKMWLIPTITANPGVQFKFTIRSFRIFNAFRNFPTTKNLIVKKSSTDARVYRIPPANYSADGLAQTLTYLMSSDTDTNCISVGYDPDNSIMTFIPPITLSNGNDVYPNEVYTQIGFPVPNFQTNTGMEIFSRQVSKSPVPVNLSGVSGINIQSNLSVNNIPISGWLAYLPMTVPYGELYSYQDQQGNARLCMNHTISHITIQLEDQDGNDLAETYCIPEVSSLDSYYSYAQQNFLPAWELVLALQVISNDGYGDRTGLPLINSGVAVHQDG